jgi:8-oxo-dGTP pyrophosphatase MutT (NUDIX family)
MKRTLRVLMLLGILASAVTSAGTPTARYDVVVVGAGPGGVAAAIQAARMGERVLLIEETDWVGGQMTAAGVSTMDAGKYVQQHPFGLYEEFVERVEAHYRYLGKDIGTCYWNETQVCFEPSVGQTVLREMLEEAGVEVWTVTVVKSVITDGGNITGLDTTRGALWTTAVVDATEWGDVLGLLPGSFRLGEEIQDITWLAIIKKYADGVPAELVMVEPPGYNADDFRESLTLEGSGPGWPIRYPVSWRFHNAYRGLPDSTNPRNYTGWHGAITKTGVNWFNDAPMTPAAVTDRGVRREETCEAKLKTLQLLYYIQTEVDGRWAVANDEGYDTPFNRSRVCWPGFEDIEANMPVIPYIREARRMVGQETLLAAAIQTPTLDGVAWGDYKIDLHGARTILDFDETWDPANRGGGLFGIPLGAIVSAEYGGLFAAEKNISASRLANGAVRLQAVSMSTGQAAGAAAAMWPAVDAESLRATLPGPGGE